MPEALKLYILGRVDPAAPRHELTVLAEHRGARAAHHVSLAHADVVAIDSAVDGVRTFIETGTPDMTRRNLQALGERFADTVLQQGVRSLFDGAVAVGTVMPLELFVEDTALALWPWEYLYDRNTQGFVCENFQPICRGVFSAVRDPATKEPSPALRILLAVGVEERGGALPDYEVAWIKSVFDARLKEQAQIRVVRVTEPRDLHEAFIDTEYDIVHYYGHGDFDVQRDEAYLALQQRSGQETPFYAEDFATLLMARNIRLVFLNACKTAVGSRTAGLIRSSMAPALVNKGVPAVVATQFVLPDASAHYLSSMIYNSLATGARLVEAVREGRQAMKAEPKSGFVDWGIPVLYTRDATCVLRPVAASPAGARAPEIGGPRTRGSREKDGSPPPETPLVVVPRTASVDRPSERRCRVAFVDLDAKVAFLPDLVAKVNAAQSYYQFSVAYLPMPSGAVRMHEEEPQLYLPRVGDGLQGAAKTLGVDVTCCLTRNYLAGDDFWNYLASPLDDPRVVVISTGALPDFAEQAGVSFAKAVLCVCLSQIIIAEGRWPSLAYHDKTVGCLFDFCQQHVDLVVGLKKMRFDHAACRRKIKDPAQLAAIDRLIATDVTEQA